MSGVSGKTSFLIIGHKMEDNREVTEGGKYKKANQCGVKILTESEFEKMISRLTGLKNFSIGNRVEILG